MSGVYWSGRCVWANAIYDHIASVNKEYNTLRKKTYKLGKIEVSKPVAVVLSVIIMIFFFLLAVVIVPAIQTYIRNYFEEAVIENFIPVEAEILSVSLTNVSGSSKYDLRVTVLVQFNHNDESRTKKLTFYTRRTWYNDRYKKGDDMTIYINSKNKRDIRSLDGGFSPGLIGNPINIIIVLLPVLVVALPIAFSIVAAKITERKKTHQNR